MKYAKLILDGIQYAPRAVTVGQTHYNPAPVDLLKQMGYLPVVGTPYPDDGGYYAGSWIERNGEIMRVWTEEPAPTEDIEALVRAGRLSREDADEVINGERA